MNERIVSRKLRIGIAGIDGFMGNAIAWLCIEAGYPVTGFVPPGALKAMGRTIEEVAVDVRKRLAAKYAHAIKKGTVTQAQVEKKVKYVDVTDDILFMTGCEMIIEAIAENRALKLGLFKDLADAGFIGIAASNSSSMGPDVLSPGYEAGGGRADDFINLHFFSPAENPKRLLVEVVVGSRTSPETAEIATDFCKSIGKMPVVLKDGSAGFLVNAGLAAYLREAENIYREGTSVEAIDAALSPSIFQMGPFQLSDYVGLDTAAAMFGEMKAAGDHPGEESLTVALRDVKRFGVKNSVGYYDYTNGKPTGVWPGLAVIAKGRGTRVASKEEIVERCMRALHDKAKELLDRGIVATPEDCDLAFVLGIGFPAHLGGPLTYGRQKGWS